MEVRPHGARHSGATTGGFPAALARVVHPNTRSPGFPRVRRRHATIADNRQNPGTPDLPTPLAPALPATHPAASYAPASLAPATLRAYQLRGRRFPSAG